MQGYIYIIKNSAFEKYDTAIKKCVKIGSTFIPVDRYFNYLTYAPEKWQYVKVYKINNSIFKNCFAIDHNFKNTSNLTRIVLDGGEEWYLISSPNEVEKQLNEWNVIFEDITTSIILKRPPTFQKKVIEEDLERKEKYLYYYQQEIVDKWNFTTGILCLATGLGKTVIACEMLNKFFTEFPNKLVIWHTKRKDILETQEIEVNVPFISIIGKEPTKNKIKGKKLVICNSARLEKLLTLISPNLIITDECHDITADNTYSILHTEKQKGCTLIGLSATPLKNNKKSYRRIYELYNNNFIASITLLEAIDKDYLVPLIFKWIQVNTNKVDNDLLIETMKEDVIKFLINCNGKAICWTDTIKSCNKWYETVQHLDVIKSHSKCDNKCNNIKEFIKEDTGTLICVDRFRQGSDDKRLALGINLSNVKNRESHVEIQMIGRLLRKNQDKTEATFVDICEIDDENDKINKLTTKIIQYCLEIDPDFITAFSNKMNFLYNVI